MTNAPPACTGRRRSMARNIFAARARRIGKGSLRSRWRLAPIRRRAWRESCRCRRTWTNLCFPDFCGASRWRWWQCKTVDLEVPANAEIVLEGYVELGEMRTEGPFGDHTGFYSLEGEFPVFHVTCITHRKDPIYLTTIVGPPPQEDYFIGHAIERVFLPVMKMQYPEIVDVAMPAEGIFQNLMIVAIRKSYPGHARKIMNAIWSLGQAMFTKVVVVVDHDVNVQDSREVVWKALCAIDPERDIQFVLGPVDTLDHAARRQDFGSKMGIDATRKWAEEGFARPWPDEIKMDADTKRRVDEIWRHLKIDTPNKKQ